VRVSAKELLKHPFVTKVQESTKSSNDAEELDQKQEGKTTSLPAQFSFAVSSAESLFLKNPSISPAVAQKDHKLTLDELNDLTTFLNNQLNLASSSSSCRHHHQHSQDFYNTRRKESILDELDIDSDSGLGTNHLENPDKIFSHTSKSEMFNKHRSYKIHKT